MRIRWSAPAAILAGALAGPLAGQAWVAPAGQGYVGFGFQHQWANEHLTYEGQASDRGTMRGESLQLGGGFVPFERLGLTAGLTFMATRWTNHGNSYDPATNTGYRPHGPHDDGDWHATFQDARLELRYRLLDGPFVLTPLAGVVVPTHEYETAGHAATGRGFVEAPFGLYAGSTLGPLLEGTWAQARYAYTVTERTVDRETGESLGTNRSNLDVELGYFATSSLSLRALGLFQWGHEGLEESSIPGHPEEFEDHDRRLRASWQKLGGGVTYSFDSVDVSAVALWTLGGKNTARWYTLALLVTWNFGLEESFFGTRTRPAPR